MPNIIRKYDFDWKMWFYLFLCKHTSIYSEFYIYTKKPQSKRILNQVKQRMKNAIEKCGFIYFLQTYIQFNTSFISIQKYTTV